MEAGGVQWLGHQKEDHAPKLLDGGTDHQTKIRRYGAGQAAKNPFVTAFGLKQNMEEAKDDRTKGAVFQQISPGGEDEIIGCQLQQQEREGYVWFPF